MEARRCHFDHFWGVVTAGAEEDMATQEEIRHMDKEGLEELSHKYNCAKMDEVEFQNRVHVARISDEGAIILEMTPEGKDLLTSAQYEAKQSLKSSIPALLVILFLLFCFFAFNYVVLKVSDVAAGAMVLFGGVFSATFYSADSNWQRLRKVSHELEGDISKTEKYYKKKIRKEEFERIGGNGEISLITELETRKRKKAANTKQKRKLSKTPKENP